MGFKWRPAGPGMFLITKKINADTLLADMIALSYYPLVNGIPQFIVRLKTTYSFFNLAFKGANGPPRSECL